MSADQIAKLASFIEETYGLAGKLTRIEGGLNNDNFLLQATSGLFHIKWYTKGTPEYRFVREAYALLILDGGKTIGSPRFVPTLSGDLRTTFNGRVLSCFTFLSGQIKYSLIEAPRDIQSVRSMGRALASIHTALNRPDTKFEVAQSMMPPVIPMERMQELLLDSAKTVGAILPASIVFRGLASIESALRKLTDNNAPIIRIHGDFQGGNLLFEGDEIVDVCDYEYSDISFRVFDLAMAISILLTSSSSDRDEALGLSRSLFDGYTSNTHVTWQDIESEALGPLVLFSLFLNLSWAISRKDDPDHSTMIGTFLAKTISCCIEWGQQLTRSESFVTAQKCLKTPASNTTL
jgi:Ser/Thr protein kinase RdoA (MazF antagonist)